MKHTLLLILLSLSLLQGSAQSVRPIYTTKEYQIYPDSVVQGHNKAVAISSTEISSNYRSPADEFQSPVIDFKFSINGKDNEMIPDRNHHFNCIAKDGVNETPLIKFGHQFLDNRPIPPSNFLKPGCLLKVRLDMRDVFAEFKRQGFYICYNGEKIYKNDFKGVYIAGKPSPLIWDFNNLVNHPELQLKDPDGDGIYEITLIITGQIDKTAPSWQSSKDLSAFPQYHSSYKISDAIYNLGLEEMQNAIEPDSTFRTGKEWGGVWTRDISYSIILSMAILQPKVAVYSLLRKVKNGRIIQDTGTGGAYPVSSDRMIWAVAAWEVYKVTGDEEWLRKAYVIINNSAADDQINIYDKKTGLVHGESSFLDWREETYPRWMQPADIYESECLGTNAVDYQVNKILSQMSKILALTKERNLYSARAAAIQNGIIKYLWMSDKGYFGQYLYGRNFALLSPRSEALGEALTVLFDIGNQAQQKSVIDHSPVNQFGIPCIYPQIPNIPPYHNNAVWPFVETFWAMAAAKAGNENAVLQAISSVYRSASLFLTNKENFVNSTGDFVGTQINSSNMLWSLSGNIAIVYKIFFGIQYQEHSLTFHPFVPEKLAGKRQLTHFKYRDAELNIEESGCGNNIKSFSLDGRKLRGAQLPDDLHGHHEITISLGHNRDAENKEISKDYTTVETPDVTFDKGHLKWSKIIGAIKYQIIKDGNKVGIVSKNSFPVNKTQFGEYQVIALDKYAIPSFSSVPVAVVPLHDLLTVEAETIAKASTMQLKGYSGTGFVEISKTVNTTLIIPVQIKKDGVYAVDFRYSNGNGPINTENKCAIRSLSVDSSFLGAIVFPQRGKGEWSNWGFTNEVQVKLNKGKHLLKLELATANENMNGDINQAMLDYLRLFKIL